ncbi:hypothetical protein CEXT_473981 [Caerostris extrusa]|uniref:Uncharacterized protein n=1 Tax=Caerostris extrusa TaxID=172846 RepID=A0AAV4WIL2_CAEEX|nr:hypothetical protein CEXT_473981 [Caerostris extrusa]
MTCKWAIKGFLIAWRGGKKYHKNHSISLRGFLTAIGEFFRMFLLPEMQQSLILSSSGVCKLPLLRLLLLLEFVILLLTASEIDLTTAACSNGQTSCLVYDYPHSSNAGLGHYARI